MRILQNWRMTQLFVWAMVSVVFAKNQSVILVSIDNQPMKLVYQSWVRPDLHEEGEWKSLDGTLNCVEQDATDAIIVESSDEQMPANFFDRYPDIESIEMTHKHLKSIRSTDLLNASSLRRLNVSHNEIDSIAEFAFDAAPRLTEIDLSFNLLHDLNENIFTSYLVKYLYLNHNQLSVVRPEWFENLLYLRELTLNNNRIRAIDWRLLAFWPSINVLHLHSNEIGVVEWSDNQQTPRSMQTYSLHDNPVAMPSHHFIWLDATAVDVRNTGAQICRITSRMSTLIAANNEIREINLDNLSAANENALVTLHLAENRLQSIENVTYFHRLRYLNVSHNLLTHIDGQVFDALVDLQLLDLSHNQLKRFDVQHNRLPSLNSLDVSNNQIFTLNLGNCISQLDTLRMDGNQIEATDSMMTMMNKKKRHIESQCTDDAKTCPHKYKQHTKHDDAKQSHISDELRDFIYEQFSYMEQNILQLIDAKFSDINRRINRLDQEMIVITTNRPDTDWD